MTSSPGEGVRARLRHLLTLDKVKRVEALAADVDAVERELLEVEQRVPLWDRIVHFGSGNEARAGDLRAVVTPRRRVLAQLREEVTRELELVGREYPPFAIGMQIERCFRMAREDLRVEGTVRKQVAMRDDCLAALEALADRVLALYVPDLDPQELLRRLTREERCREAAREPVDLRQDPSLGFEPMRNEDLVPLVARRLCAGAFFSEQARLRDLRAQREELERACREAQSAIPLLDKLRVFSDSPAESARDELRAHLDRTEESLQRSFEASRQHLFQALAAYPPLAVYQRVIECLGVASMLRAERTTALAREGDVVTRDAVAPRALVLAALRRLLETFGEVFPDVPLPLQMALELSDGASRRRRSPRELLERDLFGRLDAAEATRLRDQALDHAAMRGSLLHRLKKARGRVSLVDRLVFWADTEAEQQVERLEERSAWHERAAWAAWEGLLRAAARMGGELAPLAARDLAVRASLELAEVRTDEGASPGQRVCVVYGRDPVATTLRSVRRVLRDRYDLRGDLGALIAAVAAHPPVTDPEPEPGRFEPLSYEELVRRLARRLQATAFGELWARAQPPSATDAAGAGTSSEPSTAPETTPETTPDAERRRDRLELERLLEVALDVYPPARLHYALNEVVERVNAITARARPLPDEGPDGPHECVVQGKAAAQTALRRWCAALVVTYGRLPDYHELLEQWELRGIGEPGWVWDPWAEEG